MKYQLLFPLQRLSEQKGLSERGLAEVANISRGCIRNLKSRGLNCTLQSLVSIADALGKEVQILVTDKISASEFSTVAAAYKIERDGFDSWKIHFMELIDQFAKSLDPRLVIMPPHKSFDIRLTALLASLVCFLCNQYDLETPAWARRRYFLEKPWFVSGIESLKASAIQESPLAFRNNNIYVHANFADRI